MLWSSRSKRSDMSQTFMFDYLACDLRERA